MQTFLADSSVRTCLSAILLSYAATLVPAHGQDQPEYRDNAATSERYPDPDVELGTPAFAKPEIEFTTYDEMMTFLDGLDARVEELGVSQAGRSIPVVLFTESGTDDDFADPVKPTVLLIGLQHGNEPASGEGMLAVSARLAGGDLAPLVEKINVVIIPRANPDGAEKNARVTENSIDVNRDHILNRIPEGQAIGSAFRKYDPQVVFDAHEFTVAGRWQIAFGGVQRIDAMIQYATIANLSQHLIDLQEKVFRPHLVEAFAENDLALDWYYTTNRDGSSQELRMGGIAPTIGRNISGLRGAVSFLMEARGVGLGEQHFKRRVFTHMVGAEAILKTAASNAEVLMKETEAARADIASRKPGSPFVILSKQTLEKRDVVFVDPETGKDLPKTVDWKSSLKIEPVLTRPQPAAYVLGPDNAEAAAKLMDLGVKVLSVSDATSVSGSVYEIIELAEGVKRDSRGVDTSAGIIIKGKFDVAAQPIDIPAGAFVIRMDQPLANLAGIALEPENRSGFVANRFIPLEGDVIGGLFRIETTEALESVPVSTN